jgi:signal recognition particle receptor subunit beta
MQVNESSLDEKTPIVDIPGHGHMRQKLFDRLKETKAIVLLVDGSNKYESFYYILFGIIY